MTVSGPEDFSQKVSASTVLAVAPGMYTLSSDPVWTDGPIVSKVYNPSPDADRGRGNQRRCRQARAPRMLSVLGAAPSGSPIITTSSRAGVQR